MTLIVALILIYISRPAILRLRNNVHFDLKRQLSDFSTFMVSYRTSMSLILPIIAVTHLI